MMPRVKRIALLVWCLIAYKTGEGLPQQYGPYLTEALCVEAGEGLRKVYQFGYVQNGKYYAVDTVSVSCVDGGPSFKRDMP